MKLATGLRYHLLEWGAEDASDHTVFLIHGFLDLSWGWERTVRAGLGEGLHIVAPDMRGHGDSDRIGTGGYYHFMDYLADLHDLIRQVGRGTVSIVGHSMGGSVAAYYAGSYPERVDKLALLEGTGPPETTESGPKRVQTWLTSWQRAVDRGRRSYATLEDAAARLRRNDKHLTEELSLELAKHGTFADDGGGYTFKHDPVHLTLGPYPFRVDFAEQFWTQIKCPVLLVEGDQSVFRHRADETERRYKTFASAERAILPGAGHMMQRHQPEALAELLREFLVD